MNNKILNFFSNELSVSERLELLKRIEKDEVLRTEFIQLQNLHAITQLSSYSADKNEGLKNFHSFFKQINHKEQIKTIKTILRYAAIVIVLIASTVWTTLYISEKTSDRTLNTLYVPAGQRARITLQDGTEVWLNAKSTLTYPSHFSRKKREVEIIGEAYFNVAKNKNKPFIVSTQHINLHVLGTQFNVSSYPDAGYIQTDLVEGSLKVCDELNLKNSVILKPNEQVIIRNNQMVVENIINSERLLWKDGIYSFQNERLIDIIDKLQRYYDVTIDVKDPEIFNVRYTGKFRQNDGIDEILHIIQKIHFFKIKKDVVKNIITLTK